MESKKLLKLNFLLKNVCSRKLYFYSTFPTSNSTAAASKVDKKEFIDTRPKGERKLINAEWKPKNGGRPLRIELIDEKDFNLIGEFYNYHFVNYSNLWKAINAQYEDTEAMTFDALSVAIKKPASFAAFDGNRLVGFHVNRLHTPEDFDQMFTGKLSDPHAEFKHKVDYAEDIKNGPYNIKSNRIYSMLNECLQQTGKFLPPNIKNLGYMKVSGTVPEYMGNGLLYYLFLESLKIYKEYNYEYFIAYCLAAATFKMCTKIGMNKVFTFPYSEYKENGKPVFENLYDGAYGVHAMIGNVDVAWKILTKINEK